jgi:hypothetical protein
MAQFPNCEVELANGNVPYARHTFQVQEVKAMRPNSKGAVMPVPLESVLMFCAQCGASYILGDDAKWHAVESGSVWSV